ncbi:MAG: fibronectin type III domain-containing protein, partial [Bacteroidota bacterium]
DGIQNGDETGVDCGGANCPDCSDEPTCEDGIQNGDETGVDCGGANCPACPVEPTCEDGIQNGDEIGVDCGGANCPACPVEPTCDDGIQNGDETGIDCGGTNCAPCTSVACNAPSGLFVSENNSGRSARLNWQAVANATNYTMNIRQQGASSWRDAVTSETSVLVSPLKNKKTYEWRVRSNCGDEESDWSVTKTFRSGEGSGEPTCEDGIQNGDETGIDCGGANCPDCSDEPTCEDGIQNGDETGIDCGGANCPDCSDEPTCNDGIQNGDETGIDCGGANCPACPVEPTCDDGIQNGDETGVDCGGANCPACQTTTCETPKDLETINIIARRATLDWSPVANAVDYTIEIRPVGNPNWVERTTSNTYFRVQPLTQGLTYEWRVRTNCADESSPFSELVFFVAGSSSGNNTEDRSVVGDLPLIAKAYPSPTRSLLNVQVNQDIQQLEIIDMMGRVYDVQTLIRSNQVQQLNVSALAAGTYWLRIRANGGVKVLRFVKD